MLARSNQNHFNLKMKKKRRDKLGSKNPKKPSIKCIVLKRKWQTDPISQMGETISKNIRIDPWQKYTNENILNSSSLSERDSLIRMGLYIPTLNQFESEEQKNQIYQDFKIRQEEIKERRMVQKVRGIAMRINRRRGDSVGPLTSRRPKVSGLGRYRIGSRIRKGRASAVSAVREREDKRRKTMHHFNKSKRGRSRDHDCNQNSDEGGCKTRNSSNHTHVNFYTTSNFNRRRSPAKDMAATFNRGASASSKKKIKHPKIHLSLRVSNNTDKLRKFNYTHKSKNNNFTLPNSINGPLNTMRTTSTRFPMLEKSNQSGFKDNHLMDNQHENELSLISYGLNNHVFQQTRMLMNSNKKKRGIDKNNNVIYIEGKGMSSFDVKKEREITKKKNLRKNLRNVFFERVKKRREGDLGNKSKRSKGDSFGSWEANNGNNYRVDVGKSYDKIINDSR